MTEKTLRFDVRDQVAHITFDRPDAANSLNRQMAKDLFDAAIRCDEDPDIRAVVMSGEGPMFCSGGDLKSFEKQGDKLPAHLKEVTAYLHAAITRLARMDAPVVAAVHGAAAGAGFSIALAADLIVAAQSTKFVMAYTRAGLTPDGSSTYFLARAIGLHRAKELVLTNRTLSADEALDWGMVCRVVPDGEVLAEAGKLAESLAQGPTLAFGESKRLLLAGTTSDLESQMETETRGIAAMARTLDGHEGINAFVNKRAAVYKGA